MSSWTPNDGIDEADEEEELVPNFGGREGTIYLIDADKSITNDPEKFRLCLECIESDLLKNIMTNARDLVGVVFYNTKYSPPPKDTDIDPDQSIVVPKNCAVFMPLKTLLTESIQYFKHFKESDDFFDFENRFGTSNDSNFSEALWLCSRLFMRCNYKLTSSKLVLFTNNEQPHRLGSSELQKTFVSAKDLLDNGISVVLVPLVEQFNFEPFYKEFLSMISDTDLDVFRPIEPEEQRQILLNRVFQRNPRRNCLRHLNFTLADDLIISCDIHSFTKRAQKPIALKMFRDNNDIIIAKRCYMTDEFNEENECFELTRKLLPGELFRCQEICGKEIIFSSEELTSIKSLINPGLRLLGFKPLHTLPERCLVKHVNFLYPNETGTKGSTKLFRALWEKCLEMQKYALCTLTYRRKLPPRYAALIPQTEETDDGDGFRIVFMPMTTDYTHLEVLETEPPDVSDAGVDLFKKVCRKLRFKYKQDLFSNPSLQAFYSSIEALAFNETEDIPEDNTVPDVNYQDGKIHDIVEQITNEFGKEQAPVKRTYNTAGDGSGGSSRAKSAKKDFTMAEIEQAIVNRRNDSITISHLKDFIRSKGQTYPDKALKKTLVDIAQTLV